MSPLWCFAPPYWPVDDGAWDKFRNVYATNLVAISGLSSNAIFPGGLWLSQDQAPSLEFIRSGTNVIDTGVGPSSLSIGLGYDGVDAYGYWQNNGVPVLLDWNIAATKVNITGDLAVSGDITSANVILWTTNLVWSTNAFYYPTNAQALAVDLNKHYGDLDVDGATGTVSFSIAGGSIAADTYQTATVILRNTTGTVTNITGTTMHVSGTPWVTNRSVCTFFRDGSSGLEFTNLVVLPLW